MEYRYKEIYLEETIGEIFPKLNNSNTKYERSTLHYSIDLMRNLEVFIYLIVGKILLIKNI